MRISANNPHPAALLRLQDKMLFLVSGWGWPVNCSPISMGQTNSFVSLMWCYTFGRRKMLTEALAKIVYCDAGFP